MIKIETFIRKQPNAANDYEIAYNIIKTIKIGQTVNCTVYNVKAFRKYISDLSMKNNKQTATRLQQDNSINVTLLA